MKSNNKSKRNFKNSDFEKTDFAEHASKRVKKDKSSKKRLSIYDEFDDENLDDLNYHSEADNLFEDDYLDDDDDY